MSFPFSPQSRTGRGYGKLADEPKPSDEPAPPTEETRVTAEQLNSLNELMPLTEDQLKPLNDLHRDPFPVMRTQDGSFKGSSVAASEDLPDLIPVHNRDHSVVSVTSTMSDLRSAFGSAGSGSSLWSSGSLNKDTAQPAASDDAGSVNSADPDFDSKMVNYQKRRNARLSKKKTNQNPTYGDFLGKSANSKHSEDGLSMSLALRGMKIDQLEPLSQGTFARVYKGIWDGEGHGYGPETPVAVKCMRSRWSSKYVSAGGSEHIPVWLDREVKVCREFKHPNLIQCYLVSVDMAPYVLVLEYCSGGALSGLMDDLRASGLPAPFLQRFSWRQRVKVALDIAEGVLYLNNLKVVHRDLKPQNVLLVQPLKACTDEPVAKVGDFGLARSLAQEEDSKFLSHQVGSWEHMAPEVVDVEANADYDEKVDVYSFALILYEMASGRWPFSCMDEIGGDTKKIARFVTTGGRPAWNLVAESAPAVFQSLIPLAWSQIPGERPCLERVISELRIASTELHAQGEPESEAIPEAPLDSTDLGTHGAAPRPLDLIAFQEGLRDAMLSRSKE